MKNLFKKIFVFLAIIIASSVTVNFTSPTSAHAYECNTSFLGLQAWYCNVIENPGDEDGITFNAIQITSNIFTDISIISAYLILGFVIYGGYLYMMSSGDPGKAASSRKVLTRAFIGLAIVLLANVILNTIRMVLIGDKRFDQIKEISESVTANDLFFNAVNFAIGIASVVCVVFIVIGGITYMTSAGDSAKLQKAKNTLTYAIIGLIIVALSATITAFVSSIIRNAASNETSYINQTIIAKELYEKQIH